MMLVSQQRLMPDARAAIQHAVRDVILRFFLHLDEKEYDQLVKLLAPDGTWLRNGTLLTGPDAVLETMHRRPPGFTTRHLITNILVQPTDEQHAAATYYGTVFAHIGHAQPTGPVPIELPVHVSIFRQKMVLRESEWLIAGLSGDATFHRHFPLHPSTPE
jgi:hypothetical protein